MYLFTVVGRFLALRAPISAFFLLVVFPCAALNEQLLEGAIPRTLGRGKHGHLTGCNICVFSTGAGGAPRCCIPTPSRGKAEEPAMGRGRTVGRQPRGCILVASWVNDCWGGEVLPVSSTQ